LKPRDKKKPGNLPIQGSKSSHLREIAHCIGYEWAMLFGATETDWHKNIPALGVVERDPLRVVHLRARTELVWLHAYGELQ
jgi:hypothetical protein